MARAAVIVIGGAGLDPRLPSRLPVGALVIAADSGLEHARALGLPVEVVVGDMDSVSPAALADAEATGVTVVRHPADKDATDTELALRLTLERGCDPLVVVTGGHRGDDARLDHDFGGLLALAHPDLAPARVEAWWGAAHVQVLHGPGSVGLRSDRGALVSLLPVGGAAEGVTTTDLRFPLRAEVLGAGTTRGISNELVASTGRVHLERGTLLAIQPLALGGKP